MSEEIIDYDFHELDDDGRPVDYAGFWIRVGATLIDALALLPIVLILFYNSINMKSLIVMLIFTIMHGAYKPVMEWKKSATLGKMALKLRVVNYQYQDLSLEDSIKRNFPWILSFISTIIANCIIFITPEFLSADNWADVSMVTQSHWASQGNALFGLVFLIVVLPVIFNAKRQGLHDQLAGTYCIRE